MRILALLTLTAGTIGTLPAADPAPPLAPTTITWNKPKSTYQAVIAHISEKSGVPVTVAPELAKKECALGFKGAPMWEALETLARAGDARLVLTEGGRKVALVPKGKSQEVSATSGAFRVVVHRVVGQTLLDEGVTFHELHLLVHWEPRLRVYRIDTAPKITKVTSARGGQVTAERGGTKILPTDATSELKVRLSGLRGRDEAVAGLAGEFTVTAADRLLAFAFEAPGGKLPAAQKQANVTAALKRVQKKGELWEVAVEVTYPEGQPVFESFQGEWWLRDNRLIVRSPEGKSFVIADYEIPQPDNPHPLVAVYRFKEDPKTGLGDPTRKGWSLVYETPAPLAEVKVPFELKNIPLP